MCGISAVYGEYSALKCMFITINQLERGVQGCGVAYTCNNELKVIKDPIHPYKYFEMHYYDLLSDVRYAIMHNRLPSVGGVSYENTHPFLSCGGDFALIHNGTIINGTLRRELMLRGHKICGETDSELLTHALEDFYNETRDMVKSLEMLMETYLVGSVIVLTRESEIYACKTLYYPVYYTEANGEIYISSSSKAIEKLLNILCIDGAKVQALRSGQVLQVRDGKLNINKSIENIEYYFPTFF